MRKPLTTALVLLLLSAPVSAGGDFVMRWSTIDGGGQVISVGGNFELSGTIGQPDATPALELVGGPWRFTGGFWSVVVTEADDTIFRDGFEGS